MNHKDSKWKQYYKPVARIATFLIAMFLMAISFPNSERFRYNYELHRPWRAEDLIAPFDFPILKTDREIQADRDSILAHSLPYYRREANERAATQRDVDNMLRQYHSKFETYCPKNIHRDTIQDFVSQQLTDILSSIYDRGVVTIPDDADPQHYSDYELMLISGNVLEPYSLSELYTLKEAYTQVQDTLVAKLQKRFHTHAAWTSTLVESIPLSSIISSNVTYDAAKTQAVTTENIERVSHLQGMVLSGQKIISTGDIVNDHTVRILESLKLAYEPRSDSGLGWPFYTGAAMLLICLMVSVFLFLRFFRNDIFSKLHCVNFTLLLMTVFVLIAGIVARHHDEICFVIPFVVLPIVLRIFLDSRLAMYMHTITMLIISFMTYNSQLFLLLHIPAGMVAIVSLVNLTRRVQIVRTALLVLCTYAFTYVGYTLWQTSDPAHIDVWILLQLVVNCLLILLSYPLIYVFERMFGFISDVTLMELSDTNHKLLRELSEKAPGTFQHSVQVGNLAQAVAFKIGANAMLVRAGAMYHDIGKIVSPMYFTENQAGGINPHNEMAYEDSARIVIQHVENGVKLAKKHRIPEMVIDFIRTHHGDSQARFFYINWCNNHPGEEPDMAAFSYPGPTPQSKEEAIVMMADAVEASSKSLTNYTDETIDTLVEKIIQMQVESRQLRNAPITFHDIDEAKEVFKEKLKNIYHSRIQYPELMK